MVKMQQVRTTVSTYFANRPVVAVFIGGTQGIGHFSAAALAKQYATQQTANTSTAPLLRIYIVGRSATKANTVLSDLTKAHSNGQYRFVQAADLTSIVDVDTISKEIIRIENEEHGQDNPRIDLLVQTQGQVLFGPRNETTEGLDRSMSLLYYSRIRFVLNLLPLLQASAQPHVVSVYAAGMEATLHRTDLSLRDPAHYSFANCRSHCVYTKTMAFEHLAERYPGISFGHIYPGLVIGPGFRDESLPLWFRAVWRVCGPVVAMVYATDPEEAGMRMLVVGTDAFPGRKVGGEKTAGRSGGVSRSVPKGTDGVVGSGAYSVGRLDDVNKYNGVYDGLRKDGFREEVWTHTMKAFDTIVEGQKFMD